MGRPLKKSFFGSPANGGKQLVLSYVWLEGSTEAEEGFYVVRQVGTGRYQVTNGTKTGVVKLVDALPDAPGEGVIIVNPYGSGQLEYAKKIHNRSVVTFDGNTYKWSTNPAAADGEADLAFEAWEDPLDVAGPAEPVAVLGAVAFSGKIGYDTTASKGTLTGNFAGLTVVAFYEQNGGKLYINGDHGDEVAAIRVTIGNTTVEYGFYGSEGVSEYLSEDTFNFVGGQSYDITNIVLVPAA